MEPLKNKPEAMKAKQGTMLNHQQQVLQGVSNDKELFKKELVKSLKWLEQSDKSELKKWVKSHFRESHPKVIEEVFSGDQQFSA